MVREVGEIPGLVREISSFEVDSSQGDYNGGVTSDLVLSVSKVLSNERGQSRCHLAGEKELFGSLVYMHLLNR